MHFLSVESSRFICFYFFFVRLLRSEVSRYVLESNCDASCLTKSYNESESFVFVRAYIVHRTHKRRCIHIAYYKVAGRHELANRISNVIAANKLFS